MKSFNQRRPRPLNTKLPSLLMPISTPTMLAFSSSSVSRALPSLRHQHHFLTSTSSSFSPVHFSPLHVQLFPSSRSCCQAMKMSTNIDTKDPRLSALESQAMAVVNSVSAESVRAPDDASKSFVRRREALPDAPLDPDGLPESYDRVAIEAYWRTTRGALRKRWLEFLSVSIPFITRAISYGIRGTITENIGELAQMTTQGAEKLGPTYVKLGQMLSSRPDVLPQDALYELSKLQDGVKPFETNTAMAIIESELGAPFDEIFEFISEKPIAAASLAQVYKAKLKSSKQGEYVAIKVQRPHARATVSKDLYVLRRAAQVYQNVMRRIVPNQRIDYVALLDEWALGFYTELDFCNEARNQISIRTALRDVAPRVKIPKVYEQYCTRRILVTEWIDGKKLSECTQEEIKELTSIGQHAFLTQLFNTGLFHADPHPGNLMLDLKDGSLVLIDFGLVAAIPQDERDKIVSSLIYIANGNYNGLIDDLIALGILQHDIDKSIVRPLLEKALAPYVRGGGAMKYQDELFKAYGANSNGNGKGGVMAAMTRDAVTVLQKVPFEIPSYFALLGRAVVTLEGVALSGDPDYALILQAYPFVARRLLVNDKETGYLQQALEDVLYNTNTNNINPNNNNMKIPSLTRLKALINGAMGNTRNNDENGIFFDLDNINGNNEKEDFGTFFKFMTSSEANSIRKLLRNEADIAFDILFRNAVRTSSSITPIPIPQSSFSIPIPFPLPQPQRIIAPFLLPVLNNNNNDITSATPTLTFTTLQNIIDAIAPPLKNTDEIYVGALRQLYNIDDARRIFIDIITVAHALDVVPNIVDQTLHIVLPGNEMRGQNGSDREKNDFVNALRELNAEEKMVLKVEIKGLVERQFAKMVQRLQPLVQ